MSLHTADDQVIEKSLLKCLTVLTSAIKQIKVLSGIRDEAVQDFTTRRNTIMPGKSNKEDIISELTSMKNIGKEMARKLMAVDIISPEMLKQAGAKQSFLKIKQIYPNVCLVHLYVLQGAIDNVDFNSLSKQMKDELKEFSDNFK